MFRNGTRAARPATDAAAALLHLEFCCECVRVCSGRAGSNARLKCTLQFSCGVWLVVFVAY